MTHTHTRLLQCFSLNFTAALEHNTVLNVYLRISTAYLSILLYIYIILLYICEYFTVYIRISSIYLCILLYIYINLLYT